MGFACFSLMAISAFIVAVPAAGKTIEVSGMKRGLTEMEAKKMCFPLSSGCVNCLINCATKLIEAASKCGAFEIECIKEFLEKFAKECVPCIRFIDMLTASG